MSIFPRYAQTLCKLSILLFLFLSDSHAIDSLEFDIKKIQGNNWTAESIRFNLVPADNRHINLVASIGKLSLPQPVGILEKVKLTCRKLELTNIYTRCKSGQLFVKDYRLDNNKVHLAFKYNFAHKKLVLNIKNLSVANGTSTITISTDPQNWSIELKGKQLDSSKIASLAKRMNLYQGQHEVHGNLSLNLSMSGNIKNIDKITVQASTPALAFSSATGEIAGEELALNISSTVSPQAVTNSKLLFDTNIKVSKGTVCIDACWTIPDTAININMKGLWSSGVGQLNLKHFKINQANVLNATGTAVVDLKEQPAIKNLSFHLDKTPLHNLYHTYLQAIMIGSSLDDLAIDGHASADITIQNTDLSKIKLELFDTHIDDNKNRFGIFGLSGNVRWNNSDTPSLSSMDWQNGHLYSLPFGASKVHIESSKQSFRLKDGISLPLFDGTLVVDDFSLHKPGKPDMAWQFDGLITPISMSSFSNAIGWPTMSGKLSGTIPSVSFSNGTLEVGGTLLVHAFDGKITIQNLRMEHLLDITPTLYADVKLDKLDLDILTQTFSFGNIKGKLNGDINHLHLVNWKPVAFDARFGTPAGDESRHRISQKAVDNLTNIGGGGISGAMSRSFLSIFKEFSYKRLGISCILENNICTMGGIAPAANGYYIVEGGFLPRIDIIGFSNKVDWSSLVDRLKTITSTEGPVVQ